MIASRARCTKEPTLDVHSHSAIPLALCNFILHCMDDPDFYWLVGLLEGEGCFSFRKPNAITIALGMTDEDVVARAARLMGGTYFRSVSGQKRNPRAKPMYITHACGQRAFELMKAMRPFFGARRHAKVSSAIEAYRGPLRRACSRNKDAIVNMLHSGMKHAEVAAVIGCTPQNISSFAVRLRAQRADIPDKRHKALVKIDMIAELLKVGMTHREVGVQIGCSRPSITRCARILRASGILTGDAKTLRTARRRLAPFL